MPFPTVSSTRPVTHRDFFDGRQLGQTRQEFIEGVLYPLLAVNQRHQVILDNVLQCLKPQMRHSPWCEMLQDAMVGSGPTVEHTPSGRFSYSTEGVFVRPDVVLMTAPRDVFVPSQAVMRNPAAIVEVVSAEEEPYVTGIRFEGLRRWLDHRFTDYVLISTARATCVHVSAGPLRSRTVGFPEYGSDPGFPLQVFLNMRKLKRWLAYNPST